jgi:hypothetical protein
MKFSVTPSVETVVVDPVGDALFEGPPVFAIDFDGTLVKHEPVTGTNSADEVEFLPAMVNYIKHLLEHGDAKYGKVEIWIFTARVSDPRYAPKGIRIVKEACKREFGREFFVTALKSPRICRIVDDRALRVSRDTGEMCPSCKAAYKM